MGSLGGKGKKCFKSITVHKSVSKVGIELQGQLIIIDCQITKIVMNSGSQVIGLSLLAPLAVLL